MVSWHLAACVGCRAEYEDLVTVREWLDRLTLPEQQPEAGLPPLLGWPASSPFPAVQLPVNVSNGVQMPPPRLPRGGRLPGRSWIAGRSRIVGSAGVVVAATVAFIFMVVIPRPAAPSYQAANGMTGVSGSAQLRSTPTGTEINLAATGLPAGTRCTLIAVGKGGTDIAGSWGATYDGSAYIAGTSAFPAGQLTELRIVTDSGRLLLTIRVLPVR